MGELAFDFVTGIRPPVSALPIDARRFADVKRRFREAKDSPTSGGAGDDDDARPLFAVGPDGNWQLDAFALLAAAGSGAWLSCAQVRELVDLFEPGAPRPSPPPARARALARTPHSRRMLVAAADAAATDDPRAMRAHLL